MLFNGGVFRASALRERVLEVLASWTGKPVGEAIRELPGEQLDRAVAVGAAAYGLVRRGRGVRIRGGVGRSYYVGVEAALPAVPGMPAPLRALCVVPQGMEEGTETELPNREFGLVVGHPVVFRFLGSTQRKQDAVGVLIDDWEETIEELDPISTHLDPTDKIDAGASVPVRLLSKVTEVGTLELWFLSRDGKSRWKLEFNVREPE